MCVLGGGGGRVQWLSVFVFECMYMCVGVCVLSVCMRQYFHMCLRWIRSVIAHMCRP